MISIQNVFDECGYLIASQPEGERFSGISLLNALICMDCLNVIEQSPEVHGFIRHESQLLILAMSPFLPKWHLQAKA